MPIHEYECSGCKTRVEVFSPKETPPTECLGIYIVLNDEHQPMGTRRCEGTYSRAFPTTTSFALKGKGWAKDGY